MTGDARAAFLTGLVDDAALFPPERAATVDAVRRHAEVRGGDDAWLQGRFLVPASRLVELTEALVDVFGEDVPPWPLAVVVDGVLAEADADGRSPADAWATGLAARVADVHRVVDHAPAVVGVRALEVPLPLEGADGPERWRTAALAARGAVRAVRAAAPRQADATELWLEVPLGLGPEAPARSAPDRAQTALLRECAAAVVDAGAVDGPRVGVKVRCGGVTRGAVPHPARVAAVLHSALVAGGPIKATAGLHSSHGRTDPVTGDDQHGFLGVLGGAALVAAGVLDERGLARAVAVRSPDELRLTPEALELRLDDGHVVAADAEQLRSARRRVPSYGSCSLAEPVEALRALGVLPLDDGTPARQDRERAGVPA